MPEEVYFSSPVRLGNRNIYSLIRRIAWTGKSGIIVSCNPLALVIEEENSWFFVPLKEGIDESIVFRLDPSRR
ncbi:MAG: hypothetical protein JXA44_02525 [Methanospirillaceae archaeon]|nr:hypothetical protein [Methanospirillaceae archaeon]